MTEGKPSPSTVSSDPITKELAEWLHAIWLDWTESVPEPLPIGWRLFYAVGGSFTWLVGLGLVTVVDPRFVNFVFADPTSVSFTLALLALCSLWFGWLVAFAKRPFGPVRLFLNGLLLPAATVSIIGFSVGRLPTSPAQSPPVTLDSESSVSAQSPPVTLDSEGEEVDNASPELPGEPEGEEAGSEQPD